MDEIRFYYEYEANGYLSNFYPSPLVLDGREWPTVEHFYQAAKTLDPVFAERVRTAATPDEAKRLGRDPGCILRPDWDTWKIEVMRRAIAAKFGQHPDLAERLVATGDARLIENSMKDYFWGIGADGTGRSMLGELLMELRGNLARERLARGNPAREQPALDAPAAGRLSAGQKR